MFINAGLVRSVVHSLLLHPRTRGILTLNTLRFPLIRLLFLRTVSLRVQWLFSANSRNNSSGIG